ncbi:ATP-grasp domain-containing protein [Algibacter sp.]|uniref:ATP-grasp domain-containing protein n=1 Tax=Algibacter sp. TaxID=1872428 RepID=UPI003C77B11E
MKNNKNQISVLIPDGETHVILYIINCLSLVKDVKVYVMSSKKNDHMKYSRYIDTYIYYPESDCSNWISHINHLVEKHDIDIVLPIYEMSIKTIVENIHLIKYSDKLCDLPNIKNLNAAGNKDLLYLHLNEHNIPCPKSLIVKPDELPEIENLKFPLLIKPVFGGGGGKGIEIVETKDAVLNYYKTNKFTCKTIIQEFIEGYDLCCNVLCKDGELIAYSIQKGTLFRDGILTPQIGFDFIENEELIESTKKLMKSLNWSGVANIDWRYDETNKVFKVIEINTRFWLGTDASSIAGINYPYLYCLSSLGNEIELHKTESISYLSLEGLARSFKKNPFFIFRLKYIYNHSPVRFQLKDPLPIIYKLYAVFKKNFL